MRLDRREFLLGIGGLGVAVATGVRFLPQNRHPGYVIWANEKEFLCLDLQKNEKISVPGQNLVHCLIAWPHQPQCAVGCEKIGRQMTVVDFLHKRVLKTIPAPESRVYYGHLAMAPDNKHFYSTQMGQYTGEGFLVTYDAKTFSIVDEVMVSPGTVHDLAFLPGHDNLLAFTSSGIQFKSDSPGYFGGHGVRVEPSSLSVYDLTNKRVVRKNELDEERMVLGHLKVLSGERIVSVTGHFNDYPGPLKPGAGSAFLSSPDGTFKQFSIPEQVRARMKNELLSIAVDTQEKMLLITNPLDSQILVYELPSGRFVETLATDSRGLAFGAEDRNWYIASESHAFKGDIGLKELAPDSNNNSAHITWTSEINFKA